MCSGEAMSCGEEITKGTDSNLSLTLQRVSGQGIPVLILYCETINAFFETGSFPALT